MKALISLVYLGPGKVGSEVLRIVGEKLPQWGKQFGREVKIVGVARSSTPASGVEAWIGAAGQNLILVDTTASNDTMTMLLSALRGGGYVVSSNKKPYTAPLKQYRQLMTNPARVFYETTVGAGLPVISTLRVLLASGDKVKRIRGCFSGTLGFIFAQLELGAKYSEVVKKAKEHGYTEPDPRDDLSGLDVARKALILHRLIGGSGELEDTPTEKLYPPELAQVEVGEFMQRICEYDQVIAQRMSQAKQKGATIRYVAEITPKQCRVGMVEVDQTSDLGSLRGPDNLIVIETERYRERPMVIKGPGAGVAVTAGGVVGDITKILEKI